MKYQLAGSHFWPVHNKRFEFLVGTVSFFLFLVLTGITMLSDLRHYHQANFISPLEQLHARPPWTLSELSVGGFAHHHIPEDAHEFVSRLNEVLIVCHPDWRGIRSASINQGEPVLEVPGILNAKHRDLLTQFLIDAQITKLVINGVPPQFIPFAQHLHQYAPHIEIYFIFHGTLVQHALISQEATLVDQLIDGVKQGYIAKLGFVKTGLAPFISTLGIPAYTLSNFQPPIIPTNNIKLSSVDGHVHIGVFADDGWIKNFIVQVAAACMVEHAIIHVIQLPKARYFEHCQNQIIEHGVMPRAKFLDLMAQMDITLYISLSECYPMTVIESLAAGVPCITSDTSSIFDADPVLKDQLVVRAHDNPTAIHRHIQDVLTNYQAILSRQNYHLRWLNELAHVQWKFFLGRSSSITPPPYLN